MQSPSISVDKARLLAAAAVMRERGWKNISRDWANPQHDWANRVCLMQALAIADGREHPDAWTLVTPPAALLAVVYARVPELALKHSDNAAVWNYNDYHCDGGKQAIAILEEAAAAS